MLAPLTDLSALENNIFFLSDVGFAINYSFVSVYVVVLCVGTYFTQLFEIICVQVCKTQNYLSAIKKISLSTLLYPITNSN